MAYILSQMRLDIKAQLKDDARFLAWDEIDLAINDAMRQASHDIPQMKVYDISGTGVADYALPSDYLRGFSRIEDVEMPAGENPPVYLTKGDDWYEYEDPSKTAGQQLRLRFRQSVPTSTQKIRIRYTTSHTMTLSDSSLNQSEYSAVLYKSMEFCCRALAAKYTGTTAPTLTADAVDYGGRAQAFLFLADKWAKNYLSITGLDQDVKPAQYLTEIDIRRPGGGDYLMHPALER